MTSRLNERRSIRCSARIALILSLLWSAAVCAEPSVAFYYGNATVPSGFRDFDWVVVNPGPERLPGSFRQGQIPFAYVSIGETTPGDKSYENLPQACVMGKNPSWGGKIINLGEAGCRDYLLHKVVDPFWKEGYRAFFLDTLDSYELVSKTPEALLAQRNGLISFIHALKAAHPSAQLIANRGFSVFPEIRKDLAAVAAESLFHEWNQAIHQYQPVQKRTRRALLTQLDKVKAAGVPVIVIDYLPPKIQRAGWWEDARRIAGMGFTPYVTDKSLSAIGAGVREPMPRHILMLYSSSQTKRNSLAFRAGVMPLEYLGYIPDLRRLSEALPPAPRPGEYAGVIVWSGGGQAVKDVPAFSQWIGQCKAAGIPVLFVGNFTTSSDSRLYAALGMTAPASAQPASLRIVRQSPHFSFEMPVRPRVRDFIGLHAPADSRIWLSLKSAKGDLEDAAAITPWGGYVLYPYALETLPTNAARWLVDPFAMYQEALRLPEMPVPDTTTESGRRLFMTHIDGDGFLSRAHFPPYHIAGEVYMRRILERYKLPFTGSVIVGTLLPGNRGLYPSLAPLGVKIAREVFALPYGEIGSHMWSHPFDWSALEAGKNYPGINLPVPGYRFSPYMEAVGAAKWIDKYLAPPGKKVVIDQWSGNCKPGAQVVALAYGAGLMNINGGTSDISKQNPSITAEMPIGIFLAKNLQVFAPDANDDDFTNQWHGPYWGYGNVIQTFAMTNSPRRLKPVDIYTHWYSATRLASLSALEKVYVWVLQRPITPIYVADYAHIAQDFFRIHVARQSDGFWVGDADALREMRMPVSLGTPDMVKSAGVAGYNKSPDGSWYVHLDGRKGAYVSLTRDNGNQAYIENANAPISRFHSLGRSFTARLNGYMPVEIQFKNVQDCTVTINHKLIRAEPDGKFSIAAHHAAIHVNCGTA